MGARALSLRTLTRRLRLELVVPVMIGLALPCPVWAGEPDARVSEPAGGGDGPLIPPTDIRPPLPLPGESAPLEPPRDGPCNSTSEEACVTQPACAWVKVYGTVPGKPPIAFCHVRGTPAGGDLVPADAVPLPAPAKYCGARS